MNAEASATQNGLSPSQTNASNIWQTMVKTVRDVDTQKVGDTKEDIDTLLVFAGLFSAVVTTFVVATYPSLTPDNTDELVFLMRQSLAQNYTFVDGVLRPMAPFPVDPPFEVPLWALRVNGLWFASLIVSLSTASFGMLVKQWLIEYLAMEQWISPQEQLRARQHRHPALKHWKVFEIAAVLPLLLHISLGLFFLGLCFYTAAANEIIGRATFPLVAGWAFFALLTIAAPLASPRCPYKIGILKAALRVGRRYVVSRFWGPYSTAVDYTVFIAGWMVWLAIYLPHQGYAGFMNGCVLLVDTVVALPAFIWIPILALLSPLLALNIVFRYLETFIAFVFSDPGTDDLEEEDIMHQPYQTHELLLSVDKVVINDGPLLETMAAVLQQTKTPPQLMTAFAMGCIRHRIGAADSGRVIPDIYQQVQGFLDLRTLSRDAWTLLVEFVGIALGAELRETTASVEVASGVDDIWKANATAVLLSDARWPFPPYAYHYVLADPTALAQILDLSRPLVSQWPTRDVIRMLWIAFTAQTRQSNALSIDLRREWDRLPAITTSLPNALQTVTIQILLEAAWRLDDEDPNSCYAEAVLMLIYILNTAAPIVTEEQTARIKLQTSTYKGYRILDLHNLRRILQPVHIEIASLLEKIVATSPELIVNALDLYAVLIRESLLPLYPKSLWKVLQQTDTSDFGSPGLRPIMQDLWRFLLKCVRASTHTNVTHLQTHEFVKVCLVLARAGVPRVFGRYDPASDWEELVLVFEYAVDDDTLLQDAPPRTANSSEDHIPALAFHALQQLRGDRDAPSQLLELLAHLSGIAPRPQRLGVPGRVQFSPPTSRFPSLSMAHLERRREGQPSSRPHRPRVASPLMAHVQGPFQGLRQQTAVPQMEVGRLHSRLSPPILPSALYMEQNPSRQPQTAGQVVTPPPVMALYAPLPFNDPLPVSGVPFDQARIVIPPRTPSPGQSQATAVPVLLQPHAETSKRRTDIATGRPSAVGRRRTDVERDGRVSVFPGVPRLPAVIPENTPAER